MTTRARAAAGLAALLAAPVTASAGLAAQEAWREGPAAPPTATYWVYVGAESADLIHRVRFDAAGAAVERTIPVGIMPAEMEGPHGLAISRDGRWLHLTTGHGVPDGSYWRYELGPDTLVGPGTVLGRFPATIDVTPDGLYAFVVNFNLHGEMVPSSVSVVYTPDHTEIARIDTCVMPHGSRIGPDGLFHYSACMMDDEVVEIDTRSFEVSRRFSLAAGREGPLPARVENAAAHAGHPVAETAPHATRAAMGDAAMQPSCSPTWAQPSTDGRSVFVACNRADVIVELDRESWSIARRLPTGRGVYNLAVTPDGRLLLATLKQGAGFEVFDLESGESLARLEGSTTVAHGVVASPDSRYAFVTSEGVGAEPGRVDVYDLRALAHVGSVEVGLQAGGIAFWKMEP